MPWVNSWKNQPKKEENQKINDNAHTHPAVSNGSKEFEDWKNIGVSVISDWARRKALRYSEKYAVTVIVRFSRNENTKKLSKKQKQGK